MDDCIFCKICKKEMGTLIHEDDTCVAFNDIAPKAPVHFLVVPRKHIPTIADLGEGEEKIVGHLVKVAKELAAARNLPGYRLQFNVGKEGGQVVFHIHLHVMG